VPKPKSLESQDYVTGWSMSDRPHQPKGGDFTFQLVTSHPQPAVAGMHEKGFYTLAALMTFDEAEAMAKGILDGIAQLKQWQAEERRKKKTPLKL
jgi:hypothetical protein